MLGDRQRISVNNEKLKYQYLTILYLRPSLIWNSVINLCNFAIVTQIGISLNKVLLLIHRISIIFSFKIQNVVIGRFICQLILQNTVAVFFVYSQVALDVSLFKQSDHLTIEWRHSCHLCEFRPTCRWCAYGMTIKPMHSSMSFDQSQAICVVVKWIEFIVDDLQTDLSAARHCGVVSHVGAGHKQFMSVLDFWYTFFFVKNKQVGRFKQANTRFL